MKWYGFKNRNFLKGKNLIEFRIEIEFKTLDLIPSLSSYSNDSSIMT